LNTARNLIDIVHNNLVFLHGESCGKCTPCRDGLQALVEIYDRLAGGQGVQEDIRVLEELSQVMSLGALCGLGQAAPVPVMDSLHYFREEYVNLIQQSAYIRKINPKGLSLTP
jgi:NADH-quinone oxidoreductase subunit F